jgi:hypothetical protein
VPEERAQQVLAVLHGVSSAACAMRDINDPDGVVIGDPVIQPLRKQQALRARL